MPERNDSYGFLQTGAPSAKFPAPGATITGTICDDPVQTQQTTPGGELKTWENGDPMLQLVVTLQTDQRDSEIGEDDGKRRVFVKGQMRNALAKAVTEAGKKGLDIGGTLTVTYVSDGERTNPAFSPPKQYEIVYEAPGSDGGAGFLGTTENGQATASTASSAPDPGAAASSSVPANLPAGMTADVWNALSPEAQAALQAISAAK